MIYKLQKYYFTIAASIGNLVYGGKFLPIYSIGILMKNFFRKINLHFFIIYTEIKNSYFSSSMLSKVYNFVGNSIIFNFHKKYFVHKREKERVARSEIFTKKVKNRFVLEMIKYNILQKISITKNIDRTTFVENKKIKLFVILSAFFLIMTFISIKWILSEIFLKNFLVSFLKLASFPSPLTAKT